MKKNIIEKSFGKSIKSRLGFLLVLLLLFASAVEIQAAGGKNKEIMKNNSRQNAAKQKTLWQPVSEKSLATQSLQPIKPKKYLVFRLNQTNLQNSLAKLPLENTNAAREKQLIMEIPMPDGSLKSFRMEETQTLSTELAADFPDWKTFVGYAVDDSSVVGRFDWNILGFHAYISTGKDTVMIDPYQKGDTENYLVYNKSDYGKSDSDFYCNLGKTMEKITDSNFNSDFLPSAPEFTYGGTVRTFRIAVATTGEWSRNAAGYTGAETQFTIRQRALAVVTTTVNRLNGIYIRELASQFQLVNPNIANNQTNIIFDNPAIDPYNNTDQSDDLNGNVNQLRVNQQTLDNRVGTGQYDIGHLYGTGGGGVATSPSLCDNTDKAQGYSARGTDTGDPFVVDYVAHEIGHQFGSNHTYNNIDTPGTGACPQSSYSAANAFEPGSGSTIMSYVGICGARNLQQYVDTGFPAFHIRSLTVISQYLATPTVTTACGTVSGANNVPTVSAGAAYTIPRLTPFTLTATGADTDANDVANLLYSWEEYDIAQQPSGPMGTPAGTYDVDSDGILRPLFRVYSPVSSNSRTFPSLNFILNPANNDQTANVNGVSGNQPQLEYTGTNPTGFSGAVCQTGMTCVVGERLPTVARTMNFRVSLRDRRGGVTDAGTTVTVANGAGPFQITTQNSAAPTNAPAATWMGNTNQTITWDVANTNAAPVSAANVNILLSTDGGQTFPTVLKANTPNDGTEPITVPNITTNTARIKVEAVGNVFFDINNTNFSIMVSTAAGVSVAGRVMSAQGRAVGGAAIKVADQNGGVRTVRSNSFGYYNFADLAAGKTYVFSVTAKGYNFTPQVVSVTNNISQMTFTAQ